MHGAGASFFNALETRSATLLGATRTHTCNLRLALPGAAHSSQLQRVDHTLAQTFADYGTAAYGRRGRRAVYLFVYSAILFTPAIMQLVAVENLRQIFGGRISQVDTLLHAHSCAGRVEPGRVEPGAYAWTLPASIAQTMLQCAVVCHTADRSTSIATVVIGMRAKFDDIKGMSIHILSQLLIRRPVLLVVVACLLP